MKKLIIVLVIVVLGLAGYVYWQGTQRSTPAPTPPVQEQKPPVSNPQPTPTPPSQPTTPPTQETPAPPSEGTSTTVTVPPIDDTWKIFIAKDGTFTFQYPTRGSFAPEWQQSYIATGNARIDSTGCYKPDNALPSSIKTHNVGDLHVCQTTTYEGAAGSTFRTDYMIFQKDATKYQMITFTKKYLTDPRIQGGCEDGTKKTGICAPFDQATYQAVLEQSVGTFKIQSATQ